MLIHNDSNFFIKPNAIVKLYKQLKPKTVETDRKRTNYILNKKTQQMNILHFSKPMLLLSIPEEQKSIRNHNQTCRSSTGCTRTPNRRRNLMTSPKESRLGYKILHYQEQEVPYEIHSQMPISQINPKFIIQQKQGCAINRLPNFKLQLFNQLPGLRQQLELC
ncbi:unnamed protein product [Paramecium pentaurelia]|uniref:Uncharacterized protein n=1 Tax=Paramecium pentaurelia TaxID=43138 RepID=A0A8S1YH04_9CILI|nr:unnamed protein product [Paramecium pentaurelia]